jgi:hypothetical protein
MGLVIFLKKYRMNNLYLEKGYLSKRYILNITDRMTESVVDTDYQLTITGKDFLWPLELSPS